MQHLNVGGIGSADALGATEGLAKLQRCPRIAVDAPLDDPAVDVLYCTLRWSDSIDHTASVTSGHSRIVVVLDSAAGRQVDSRKLTVVVVFEFVLAAVRQLDLGNKFRIVWRLV